MSDDEQVKGNASKGDRAHTPLGVPLEPLSGIETLPDPLTYSIVDEHGDRLGRLLSGASARSTSRSPAPVRTWKDRSNMFWGRNKGLALVILAQLFGSVMSLTTRLLETEGAHGHAMHPFQILLVRMSITVFLSLIYLYWAKIPDAPLGKRDVRGLLVARGLGGFFGVFGLFYSLQYLPIAEATVISFLAPTVACFACWVVIHEPFTRSQQVAGLVSILGVVLIARPTSLLPNSTVPSTSANGVDGSITLTNSTITSDTDNSKEVTLGQRLSGIGMALIGVCGAACAYTTLRWIGKRAHPLISVTYFSTWCMLVSIVAIVAVPSVGFRLPSNVQEWGYLILMGLCGFIMQILLTAGLAHEKSSRATNMVYTQILFALAFDKLIFNTTPGGWSIVGSSLVLGSALYVAVHKEKVEKKISSRTANASEEVGLMIDVNEEADVARDGSSTGGQTGAGEIRMSNLRAED